MDVESGWATSIKWRVNYRCHLFIVGVDTAWRGVGIKT